jgi:hypothetical protein
MPEIEAPGYLLASLHLSSPPNVANVANALGSEFHMTKCPYHQGSTNAAPNDRLNKVKQSID